MQGWVFDVKPDGVKNWFKLSKTVKNLSKSIKQPKPLRRYGWIKVIQNINIMFYYILPDFCGTFYIGLCIKTKI